MQTDVHSGTTTPNLAAPAPATTYKFQVLRTRPGIVQQRTTVGGQPVALMIQRSTYGHEVDSVPVSASSTIPAGPQREDVPEGREQRRLHVQLVLTPTQKTSYLLLLRAAAKALEERSTRTSGTRPSKKIQLKELARGQSTRAQSQPRGQAAWSARTTSRPPTYQPPTTPGATARGTPVTGTSEPTAVPDPGQEEGRHCPAWSEPVISSDATTDSPHGLHPPAPRSCRSSATTPAPAAGPHTLLTPCAPSAESTTRQPRHRNSCL